MTDTYLVAVAWPYANARIHVGNLTGSYLPADIFARYQRLRGNRVLMVSGSDSHGTPVTVRADAEGTTAYTVYQRFHNQFLELFQQLGLTYDLFTSTHTQNHFKVAQSVFKALLQNGFLYTETRPQWYSPAANRFLPDRYVEGTCYICGFEGARSDQCDRCGNVLEPERLIDPRSKVDGSTPELRDTEHYYLDLSKLEPEVAAFLRQRQDYWRETVFGQSMGQIESEGLRARSITRDLDWGIPVPVEGWEGKCLYVWFEAVIGYLSAPIEYAALRPGDADWKDFWLNPEARALYFIGKDNIFFHTAMWPAELMGVGDKFPVVFSGDAPARLTLPYDVPANQFMNLEGRKISGSRNWVVDGLDFLTRYDPDPLRYYLTANMPETRDTDWDWDGFYHRNNDELVATWGNLVNRVLSFAHKHWEGRLPDPGELTEADQAIIATVEAGFERIGKEIDAVRLRSALSEAMALATEVNRYLDTTGPWVAIKQNKAAAGRSIYTAIRCIDSLKTLFAPFLPFTSQRVHTFLGYEGNLFGTQSTQSVQDDLGEHQVLTYHAGQAIGAWQPSQLQSGQTLLKPEPLFRKLDPGIVEEERSRLGQSLG